MNDTDFWRLFRETGRPEYYLLYRESRGSAFRRGNGRPAGASPAPGGREAPIPPQTADK